MRVSAKPPHTTVPPFVPSPDRLRGEQQNDANGGLLLKARDVRRRYGNCSDMWIWRRLGDESGFPQPLRIGPFRYWRLRDLIAWENSLAHEGPASAPPSSWGGSNLKRHVAALPRRHVVEPERADAPALRDTKAKHTGTGPVGRKRKAAESASPIEANAAARRPPPQDRRAEGIDRRDDRRRSCGGVVISHVHRRQGPR